MLWPCLHYPLPRSPGLCGLPALCGRSQGTFEWVGDADQVNGQSLILMSVSSFAHAYYYLIGIDLFRKQFAAIVAPGLTRC